MDIGRIEVAPQLYETLWGVRIYDYELNGVAVDLQTLLVEYSTSRATTIEDEISPLSTLVEDRNTRLEKLGNALSDLSEAQKTYDDDDPGTTKSTSTLEADTITILRELAPDDTDIVNDDSTITKQNCEKAIQLVKTKIDKLNNDAQSDMTRLQSLVDKRDEAFSTASSLMSSVSDTRSNAIRNM